jgi:hypothetical protein
MSKSGIFSGFSFGMEQEWGKRVPADHLLEAKDGSGVNTDLDNQVAEVFNQQMAKNVDVFPGLRKDEGQFDMYFLSDIAPYFMVALLGAVDTVEQSTSGIFQHTITESPSRPTMTIEQQIGDLPTLCTGFQPNEMDLTIATGSAVDLSFKGFAKNTEVLNDPSTPTASTRHLLHHANDITAEIDGIAFNGITNFSLNYKNNATAEHDITHGSQAAYRGLGKTEYEGEIEFIVDSENAISEFKKYLSNTMRSMKIIIEGQELGSSGVKEKLTIDLAKINFSQMEVPATFETVKAKVSFVGMLDRETGDHIKFTVLNNVASLAS